jgi:hypothetical protein
MSFGYDAPTEWPEEEKNEVIKVINITISVFFDGTMNNKNNTLARLEYEKKQAGLFCDDKLASYYESKGKKKTITRMLHGYLNIMKKKNRTPIIL